MARQLLGKEVTAALNEKIKMQVEALKKKGVEPTLGNYPGGRERRRSLL